MYLEFVIDHLEILPAFKIERFNNGKKWLTGNKCFINSSRDWTCLAVERDLINELVWWTIVVLNIMLLAIFYQDFLMEKNCMRTKPCDLQKITSLYNPNGNCGKLNYVSVENLSRQVLHTSEYCIYTKKKKDKNLCENKTVMQSKFFNYCRKRKHLEMP